MNDRSAHIAGVTMLQRRQTAFRPSSLCNNAV